jgi:hypothetical protein
VPTPEQAKLLKVALELDDVSNVKAICEAADIPRSTFYRWLKDIPEFKQRWVNRWRVFLDAEMPEIVDAQIKAAKNGETAAAQFIAKLGNYLTDKVDVSTEQGGGLMIIKLPEERKE